MKYTLEYTREKDGRWMAEVPQLYGVAAYGESEADARTTFGTSPPIALLMPMRWSATSRPRLPHWQPNPTWDESAGFRARGNYPRHRHLPRLRLNGGNCSGKAYGAATVLMSRAGAEFYRDLPAVSAPVSHPMLSQHRDIPPTNLLRQALLHVILAGFGMDSSFLNLSFTW